MHACRELFFEWPDRRRVYFDTWRLYTELETGIYFGKVYLAYEDSETTVPVVKQNSDPESQRDATQLAIIYDVEICLVTSPDAPEDELQLARDVKSAVDDYHDTAAESEDMVKGYRGEIKIFTGDEVPACPCCGMRK
jgi:hypothetical protein